MCALVRRLLRRLIDQPSVTMPDLLLVGDHTWRVLELVAFLNPD